ncbi:hypothetical protein [Natrialba asiatica]|uniref:Uncharacterized protein n=1 Tax=Natrialba asiatica (strain ATCC 700177 / DSM 12278 / JCM 9576 / FERM P-10747 / NBRC 102637 / 172P1) TaxID=29540 RepID=M0ALF9_NATA1|nr:hypothetical protein [Natrialba asiatica]ELY99176.1 hypothetical protein C481_15035 [Natrialba asiatica DSM 12278]
MSAPVAPTDRSGGKRLQETAVAGVRAIAFWIAVVLPAAYLPVLSTLLLPVAPTAVPLDPFFALVALLAVHGSCVLLGHEHAPGYERRVSSVR